MDPGVAILQLLNQNVFTIEEFQQAWNNVYEGMFRFDRMVNACKLVRPGGLRRGISLDFGHQGMVFRSTLHADGRVRSGQLFQLQEVGVGEIFDDGDAGLPDVEPGTYAAGGRYVYSNNRYMRSSSIRLVDPVRGAANDRLLDRFTLGTIVINYFRHRMYRFTQGNPDETPWLYSDHMISAQLFIALMRFLGDNVNQMNNAHGANLRIYLQLRVDFVLVISNGRNLTRFRVMKTISSPYVTPNTGDLAGISAVYWQIYNLLEELLDDFYQNYNNGAVQGFFMETFFEPVEVGRWTRRGVMSFNLNVVKFYSDRFRANEFIQGQQRINLQDRFVERMQMLCFKKPETAAEKALFKFVTAKGSVVRMMNKDNLCTLRCIVVSLMHAMLKGEANDMVKRFMKLPVGMSMEIFWRKGRRGLKFQYEWVLRLCKEVGIQRGVASESDLIMIAQHLNLTIRVFDMRCSFAKVWSHENQSQDRITYVNLLKDGDHCHTITSYKGLMGRSYECKPCNKVFNNQFNHQKCRKRCFYCRASPCAGGDVRLPAWILCEVCNRKFPNEPCYAHHLEKKLCERVMSCGKFGCPTFNPADYRDVRTHKCTDMKCKNCRFMEDFEHHTCPMLVLSPKIHQDEPKLAFFDFECTQENGNHEVTHCVFQLYDGEEHLFKPTCGQELSTVLDEFCEFLFGLKKFRGYTVMAHNGQGYDFHFILQWCLSRGQKPSFIIRNGQKIKSMSVMGVRFLDSLCFLTMPLSSIPKTFGISELRKGFFPHLFNKRENFGYVGPLPEKHFYMDCEMGGKTHSSFQKWYKEQDGKTFDFDTDIIEYCKSDVDILRRGCLQLRELFMELTDVDPFDSLTIAGACLAVFKTKFLMEESIYPMSRTYDAWVRRSLMGGRTQVFQSYVSVEGTSSKLRYIDVKSLYPWVNTFCEYPVGKPEQLVTWAEPITEAVIIQEMLEFSFGFMEVDVTPPTDILHPLLGSHCENRLVFDNLPKTKAVYTTVELKKAVELGYVITKVYSVLNWANRTTDLFKGYMLNFLKLKQESSGWGDKRLNGEYVETEEEKEVWVREYHGKEGIWLEKDKIEYNAGIRALSKLCLNSLWGKLGQREYRRKTSYIDNANMLMKIMLSAETVHDIVDVQNSNLAEVIFTRPIPSTDLKFDLPHSYNSCVALACFTTSHARLKLYSMIERMQDKAIYCDTDSLVYREDEGDEVVELGDNLGDWTDELEGDHIVEFVGLGPKSYSYRTFKGKTAVKCKGFRLNVSSEDQCLNFDNMKNMVMKYHGKEEEGKEVVDVVDTKYKISRDRSSTSLFTHTQQKKLQATLHNKGTVDADSFRVLPFGFKE